MTSSGDGPLRRTAEALVRELGVQEKITLHGAKGQVCVRKAMMRSHIFVLASVTAANGDQEGQGLVLQEAQATGLPVIATDHNGFGESIMPGLSGFLVPERDVEGLAYRLRYLLEHPESWHKWTGRQAALKEPAPTRSRRAHLRLVELYEEVARRYQRDKARV